MTTTVTDIYHMNKPMGGDPNLIRKALAAEFVEVTRDDFERFVSGVNFRRQLMANIRKYWLVSTGKLVAFYVNESPGRFFIEPTGTGVVYL